MEPHRHVLTKGEESAVSVVGANQVLLVGGVFYEADSEREFEEGGDLFADCGTRAFAVPDDVLSFRDGWGDIRGGGIGQASLAWGGTRSVDARRLRGALADGSFFPGSASWPSFAICEYQ